MKTKEEQTRVLETDDYDIPASQSNHGKKTNENEQCQETEQNRNIEEEKIKDQTAVTSEGYRNNIEPQIKTRSGRVIKRPIRFKDYQL